MCDEKIHSHHLAIGFIYIIPQGVPLNFDLRYVERFAVKQVHGLLHQIYLPGLKHLYPDAVVRALFTAYIGVMSDLLCRQL